MRAFLWTLLIASLAAPSWAREGSGLIRPAPPVSRNAPAVPSFPNFPKIHFPQPLEVKPAPSLPPPPSGGRPAPRPESTPALPPRPPPAERIADLSSDIQVAKDGGITVTQTIAVHSEGHTLEVAPEFPLRITDTAGNRVHVRFDLQSVELDGHSEPYFAFNTYDAGNTKRLYMNGAKLANGNHTYRIVYKTDRRIGFFDSYDRLAWDVTGTGLELPIERASATVHLPDGTRFNRTEIVTGSEKSPAHNGAFEIRGSSMRIFTTRLLESRQRLRFTLDFSKGAVTPPGPIQSYLYLARDNAITAVSLLGLLAASAYYFAAWFAFGRDPARSAAMPLFAPPENLSAAEMRYIRRMGYDRKCFTAALAGMAAKGYLTIRNDDNTYVLTRTGQTEQEAELSDAELVVARVLFQKSDTLVLDNDHAGITNRALDALASFLEQSGESRDFVSNRLWFYGGVAILAASTFAAYWFADTTDTAVRMVLWSLMWAGGIATVLHLMGGRWIYVFTLMAPRFILGMSVLITSYYHLSQYKTVSGETFGGSVPIVAVLAFFGQCLLAVAFYFLLKTRTSAGGKIRDEIDAFKRFLDTADKDQAAALHAPRVTAQVFEQFLPYAIALDSENSWSKKFAADAAREGKPLDETYRPSWYLSGPFRLFGSVFTWNFGNSLTDATRAGVSAGAGRRQ